MTYNGLNPLVRNTDAFGRPCTLDAFGRSRVSNITTLLAGKQSATQDLLNFENATTGTGTANFITADSALQLTAGLAGVGKAQRQSRTYANYQPGKSQLIFMTFTAVSTGMVGAITDRFMRVGYFDDDDGFFFEIESGATPTLSFNRRSSGSNGSTKVAQASWNIDPLDGTGPSGKTLDWQDKSQILYIAFEALLVGSGEMGFVIDGELVPCHLFTFANQDEIVYMAHPNLPVRWEVEDTDGTNPNNGILYAICCSVNSEGGQDPVGSLRGANTGFAAAGHTVGANVRESLIGIRLNPSVADSLHAVVDLVSVSATTSATAQYLWELLLNPTVAGQSWVSVASSPVQYDVSGTTISAAGTLVASGHAGGAQGAAVRGEGFTSLLTRLQRSIAGTPSTLVLAVAPLVGNEEFYGAMNWFEYS